MPLSGSPANRVADDGNWRLLDEPEFCRYGYNSVSTTTTTVALVVVVVAVEAAAVVVVVSAAAAAAVHCFPKRTPTLLTVT